MKKMLFTTVVCLSLSTFSSLRAFFDPRNHDYSARLQFSPNSEKTLRRLSVAFLVLDDANDSKSLRLEDSGDYRREIVSDPEEYYFFKPDNAQYIIITSCPLESTNQVEKLIKASEDSYKPVDVGHIIGQAKNQILDDIMENKEHGYDDQVITIYEIQNIENKRFRGTLEIKDDGNGNMIIDVTEKKVLHNSWK